jgi:hypothetical protein
LARAWGAPDDGSVAVFVTQLCEYDLLEPAGELDAQPEVAWSGRWTAPTIERQAEPLQNIMVSAFDPSIPLAE